jgi:hypothetical protein
MQERLKRRVGGKGGEDEEGGIIDRLNRLRIILLISLQTIKDFHLPSNSFYFTSVRCQLKLRKLSVFSVAKLSE